MTALVRRWLPLRPPRGGPTLAPSSIRLRASRRNLPEPETASLLRLGTLHVYDAGTRFLLRGALGTTWGVVEPQYGRARLGVDPGAGTDDEVYYALAIAAALLLGGRARALIHGGALVRPGSGAWLLIGDSHAGKSSTIATATAAGWEFLSDDQVIVWDAGATVQAEGLLRRFHLDHGYTSRRVTGTRDRVVPAALRAGRWRRSAQLAGLLFPVVAAEQPTCLTPVSAAEALTLLIRQSPWLLADRATTEGVLALFTRIAGLPAYRLRLGLDSYNQPAALAAILDGLD